MYHLHGNVDCDVFDESERILSWERITAYGLLMLILPVLRLEFWGLSLQEAEADRIVSVRHCTTAHVLNTSLKYQYPLHYTGRGTYGVVFNLLAVAKLKKVLYITTLLNSYTLTEPTNLKYRTEMGLAWEIFM